ncbi:DUF6438 domain-containing protein [Sphingomonas sp. Y38-1Y]|uniref:DUF6438 domain-containing protein n=1 Tax=Sphingomonas sp. Y38-1Y TaxID=3078265 RepID=UPI0028EAE12F|nr:DUF6438 domain-containing protein [Sphingomonas sp. Y38-1Y]
MAIHLAALAALLSPAPAEAETITLEMSGCYGTCPIYRVTVDERGNGVFVGKRFTWVSGERHFPLPTATFDRFRRHLEAVRPKSGDLTATGLSPACAGDTNLLVSDGPTATISWSGGGQRARQTLVLYLSCPGREARRWSRTVQSAPDLLPIGEYIGTR